MEAGGNDAGRAARRRATLLLYALATFSTASHGSLELIFPLNLDRLGHPLPLIGTTVALMALGALLSRVPGGAWYRPARGRSLSAASLAVMGLSTLGMALTHTWLGQALLAFSHGVAFGLASTFLMALLIESRTREEGAGTTMAWYTAAISAGYAISAPLAAFPIEWWGYEVATLISAATGLVGAALTLLLPPVPRGADAAARPDLVPGGAAAPAPAAGWRSLFSLPAGVWLATVLGFYINFVSDVYNTFFPLYAVTVGVSLGAVGVMKAAHSGAATGIRFASAALLHVVDARVANNVALVLMAVALAALSVLTNEALLLALFVVLGLCRGVIRVTSSTMVAEERRKAGTNVGMASAVYNAGLDLGTMLGPPVAGVLAGALDIPTAFRVVAVALPGLYYGLWLALVVGQRRRAA